MSVQLLDVYGSQLGSMRICNVRGGIISMKFDFIEKMRKTKIFFKKMTRRTKECGARNGK